MTGGDEQHHRHERLPGAWSCLSIHNSLVAGNTVLDDGSPRGHSGCTVALAVGGSTHEGPASSNTRVSNNLANQVWLWNQGESA